VASFIGGDNGLCEERKEGKKKMGEIAQPSSFFSARKEGVYRLLESWLMAKGGKRKKRGRFLTGRASIFIWGRRPLTSGKGREVGV